MKIAITSDLHLGDPNCVLVNKKNSDNFQLGVGYEKFKNSIDHGTDYLILLGDIFETAINSYKEAFDAGRLFLSSLHKDLEIKSIIYTSGNHDFDLWQFVETEVNVTKRINNSISPREFRWSIPCIIDDRIKEEKLKVNLPTVSRDSNGSYGGLFLEGLADKQIPFIVAYPNIYLITSNNESILLTHGQYFDQFWSFLGEILIECADKYLNNDILGELNLKEFVQVNFPFNQLGSSGVGQAGIFTDFARKVQREVKDGDDTAVKEIINNLMKWLDRRLGKGFVSEIVTDKLIKYLKKQAINALSAESHARFNDKYIKDIKTRERFQRFLKATSREIDDLRSQHSQAIPNLDRIIFGHTHQPMSLGSKEELKLSLNDQLVRINNTGGWLTKKVSNIEQFVGASVFKYETGKSLQCETIKTI